MKILLIQSPRKYWPFLSEEDNYILPQWMPCIAAMIRQAGYEAICVDCVASQIGWKSLENIIKKKSPKVVCISEAHALYVNESLKLVHLIKRINSEIIVICGGGQFANTSEDTIMNNDVDYIVKGEGENTVVDLLEKLDANESADTVNGIAYKSNGQYNQTPPRDLIKDLDILPMPAYDLMPMDKYGKSKFLFSPGGMTIHHSRGCPNNCSFCVWWTQMAERKLDAGKEILSPRWRTKSVGKTIDEMEHLISSYNRKCFIFVDGSWNIDPDWNLRFAEELIKRKLNIKWFAFMRVDCILRDEKQGIMEKLVKSGLSHMCIGVEHCSEEVMADYNKRMQTKDTTKECLEIMNRKYPEVFVQATFIIGTREESRETLKALAEYVKKLKIDYPAFHLFTPVPGTELYEKAKENNRLEVENFEYYDWNTPIISTKHLSREDMEWELYRLYKKVITLPWLIKGLFNKSAYKRNMYVWWIIVTIRITISSIKDRVWPSRNVHRLVTPDWYDN